MNYRFYRKLAGFKVGWQAFVSNRNALGQFARYFNIVGIRAFFYGKVLKGNTALIEKQALYFKVNFSACKFVVVFGSVCVNGKFITTRMNRSAVKNVSVFIIVSIHGRAVYSSDKVRIFVAEVPTPENSGIFINSVSRF